MAGGGGAWKVAYADFVTAMMAFFMVMWLTAQSADVKKAVAEHFRNPGGKRLSGNDSKSLVPTNNVGSGSRRAIRGKGSKKADGEDKFRRMADEGDRSNIGKVIEFEVNSVTLSDSGKREIISLLPELDGKSHRLEVRGHASANGGATVQANLDACNISYRRSIAVMQYLTEVGIDPRRIRLSQAGSSEPRISQDPEAPTSDSRVEVFVLKELFEEPESRVQRLVSAKALDEKAEQLAEKDAAAAKNAPAPAGHH